MCHSGQTKAQERKASRRGLWVVRGSCGEEVVLNVERTVSPGEVQAFAMETNRGFDVGSTVLFQGSELHIKACIREFEGYMQCTEIPLSGLPFLSNLHRATMSQPGLRKAQKAQYPEDSTPTLWTLIFCHAPSSQIVVAPLFGSPQT